MYMNINVKKIILIILGIGLLIFAAIGIRVYLENRGFKIKSITPDSQNVSTLTPYFDITFNKAPTPSSVKVSSIPVSLARSQSLDGKRLRIFTKLPLNKGYSYKINFSVAADNNLTINKSITFVPKLIDFKKLPKDQQEYTLNSQDNGPMQDPIVKHLPYGTLDYSLNYELNNNGLVLNARILLTGADTKSGEAAKNQRITKYKKEVVDYIRSLGLDPAKYTINYIIVEQP
jgi:hypothetical protein